MSVEITSRRAAGEDPGAFEVARPDPEAGTCLVKAARRLCAAAGVDPMQGAFDMTYRAADGSQVAMAAIYEAMAVVAERLAAARPDGLPAANRAPYP